MYFYFVDCQQALFESLIVKRKINLNKLHKVEATSVLPLAHKVPDIVQAIIKVKEMDYVPVCVHRRTSISPFIFIGEFKYDDLESLEHDPNVESISISKELKSAE